jgi:hypothetical protein
MMLCSNLESTHYLICSCVILQQTAKQQAMQRLLGITKSQYTQMFGESFSAVSALPFDILSFVPSLISSSLWCI